MKETKLSAEELVFEQTREKALNYFQGISEQDEVMNDFIIDAIVDYKLKQELSQSLFVRIIVSPLILGMLLAALFKQLFEMMKDFLFYGGEFLSYKKHNSLKTINDIYKATLREASKRDFKS